MVKCARQSNRVDDGQINNCSYSATHRDFLLLPVLHELVCVAAAALLPVQHIPQLVATLADFGKRRVCTSTSTSRVNQGKVTLRVQILERILGLGLRRLQPRPRLQHDLFGLSHEWTTTRAAVVAPRLRGSSLLPLLLPLSLPLRNELGQPRPLLPCQVRAPLGLEVGQLVVQAPALQPEILAAGTRKYIAGAAATATYINDRLDAVIADNCREARREPCCCREDLLETLARQFKALGSQLLGRGLPKRFTFYLRLRRLHQRKGQMQMRTLVYKI